MHVLILQLHDIFMRGLRDIHMLIQGREKPAMQTRKQQPDLLRLSPSGLQPKL